MPWVWRLSGVIGAADSSGAEDAAGEGSGPRVTRGRWVGEW